MFRKWFRTNAVVSAVVNWVGLFTIIGGVFSWIALRLKFMGDYGWPEAVFLGVTVTMFALLCVSLFLAAWRYFKPLPSANAIVEGNVISQIETDQKLIAEVGRISKLVDALVLAETAKEKIAFIDKTLAHLESLRNADPPTAIPPKFSSVAQSYSMTIHGFMASAKTVFNAEEMAELSKLMGQATTQITSNARYYTLEGDDSTRFGSPHDKQAYHVYTNELAAAANYLKGLRPRLVYEAEAPQRLRNGD